MKKENISVCTRSEGFISTDYTLHGDRPRKKNAWSLVVQVFIKEYGRKKVYIYGMHFQSTLYAIE